MPLRLSLLASQSPPISQVQEDAEANCTAPYRAPELFDVRSDAAVDERVDVWGLGCTAFAAMYGASPFEAAAGRPGGSLALAAMSGALAFPAVASPYPEPMHGLVRAMLEPDPGKRPWIGDVQRMVEEVERELLQLQHAAAAAA